MYFRVSKSKTKQALFLAEEFFSDEQQKQYKLNKVSLNTK